MDYIYVNMFDEGYITLEHLSACLNLPQKYLRSLAIKGDVPCLNANGRLRFSEKQVRDALDRKAAQLINGKSE